MKEFIGLKLCLSVVAFYLCVAGAVNFQRFEWAWSVFYFASALAYVWFAVFLHLRFRVRDIRGPDGSIYLRRFAIFGWLPGDPPRRFFPSIYLHKFFRPDADEHLHTHPWQWAWSFVMWGGYQEERVLIAPSGVLIEPHIIARGPGSIVRLFRNDAHRVTKLYRARSWSLVIASSKKIEWGFLDKLSSEMNIIPWREYLGGRKK